MFIVIENNTKETLHQRQHENKTLWKVVRTRMILTFWLSTKIKALAMLKLNLRQVF